MYCAEKMGINGFIVDTHAPAVCTQFLQPFSIEVDLDQGTTAEACGRNAWYKCFSSMTFS